MKIELYTELRNSLELRLDKADKELGKYPVNELGLLIKTPNALKAKRNFDIVFNQLRVLNSSVSNKIKRQYQINKNGGTLYNFKKTV